MPRELSAEEKRLYREELEKAVIVIEDKALDAYRSGYAKALEIGVYNKHTRALRGGAVAAGSGRVPQGRRGPAGAARGRAAGGAGADRGDPA